MKKYILCFLTGGVLSIAAEFFLQMLLKVCSDYGLAITLMLAIMAALGAVLAAVKIYGTFEKHGGYGAMLPFSGFAAAIVTLTGLSLGRKSCLKAMGDGLTSAAIIFGIGLPLAFIVALIMNGGG
ncbi:MAG: SpoVA/SpoVAEb family sporulation membrane protein [Lachnospiraceae bacterium]|nr:SpoVA/SpoVAEb family sporulation membrane protein [Lachnospiraceae bacterium]